MKGRHTKRRLQEIKRERGEQKIQTSSSKKLRGDRADDAVFDDMQILVL